MTRPLLRQTSRLVLVVTALGAFRVAAFAVTHVPSQFPTLVLGYDVLPVLVGLGAVAALFLRPTVRATIASCVGAAVLALYIAEAVFTFGSHPPTGTRPRPAGLTGPWDPRSPLVVMLDDRARGVNAYPSISRLELEAAYRAVRKSGTPYPLASLPNTFTVYCNEGGATTTYTSDRHGFNNPPGVWDDPSLDVALLGDSFTQGACVDTSETVAAQIRHRRSAISLGVNGYGPLSELAILREYAAPLRPRHLVWLFFPGNDFLDLASERAGGFLPQYRARTFRQSLIDRQGEIDGVVRPYLDAAIARELAFRQHRWRGELKQFITLRHVRERLFPVLIPEWGRMAGLPCGQDRLQEFTDVVAQARSEVSAWGGRFYLVYLPMWPEGTWNETCRPSHDSVIKSVALAGVPVIDLQTVFDADSNQHRLWQPPYAGTHLTPAGYALAARVILDTLAREVNSP
jgi:hypothetical protein